MDRIKKSRRKVKHSQTSPKTNFDIIMASRVEKNGQSIASRKLLVRLPCYIHYANHIPQIHRITPRTIANSKSYSVLVYLL